MKSVLLTFFLVAAITSGSFGQSKNAQKTDEITPEDFQKIVKSGDTVEHAVILSDVANVTFKGNEFGWFSYVLKAKMRILVLKSDAFEAGNVALRTYGENRGERRITATEISAASYVLEDGKVIKTVMNPKDIFVEKIKGDVSYTKFSVPGMKEGCIIEYSYTETSDFTDELPSWNFQSQDYPVLKSEYNAAIPSMLEYLITKVGVHQFSENDHKRTHGSFFMRTGLSVASDVENYHWVMRNLPKMKDEIFLSTPKNYIDRLEFQIVRYYNGRTITELGNNWKTTTADLLSSSRFAYQLQQENPWLDEQTQKIAGSGDFLERSKRIYYYILNNYVCTDPNDEFVEHGLSHVFEKKQGTVGEINMLLCAMLRFIHVHADPVILSTRNYGVNSKDHYLPARFNHMVIRAYMMGQTYMLDASTPIMGFGHLPLDCYNGHARIICDRDSASIFLIADSIRETQLNSVFIVNDPDKKGQMTGTFNSVLGYHDGYDVRKTVANKGMKEFAKSILASSPLEVRMLNFGIDSLMQFEEPIGLHFDFNFDSPQADIFYFNPLLYSDITTGLSLPAGQRDYPIEMEKPIDKLYVMNIEVPAGFVIDEVPQSARISYNNNEGTYEYLVGKMENGIQIRVHLKMKKALFASDEYEPLRSFFNYAIKKESEQIVFKKKS
jgi:Transglutaminase-like superfamily